jgi:hypothetical protein
MRKISIRKKLLIPVLCVMVMMVYGLAVHASSSVSISLKADQKSNQSSYETFEASKMTCQVTSKSKYPIKFQAYGRNSTHGKAFTDASVTYNVNATGTVNVSGNHNQHSIKLTGWNITKAVKGCVGYGKIY